MLRASVSLLVIALVVFHGRVLVDQFQAGHLDEPGGLVQWLVACGLVASLWALQRSGESLASRRGVAVCAMAALLHGPALSRLSADPGLSETTASMLQVMPLAGAGALALGAFALAARSARRGPRPGLRPLVAARRPVAAVPRAGFDRRLDARPPPRG
jgi:hypothetical protein